MPGHHLELNHLPPEEQREILQQLEQDERTDVWETALSEADTLLRVAHTKFREAFGRLEESATVLCTLDPSRRVQPSAYFGTKADFADARAREWDGKTQPVTDVYGQVTDVGPITATQLSDELDMIRDFRNLDAHGSPHFCSERGLLILTPADGAPEEEVSIEMLDSLRSMMDRSSATIKDLVKMENVRLDPSFRSPPPF